MAEELDNPLDDDLLRELGLEPQREAPPQSSPNAKGQSPVGQAASRPQQARPASGQVPPGQVPKAPPKTSVPPAVAAKPTAPSVSSEENFGQGIRNLAEDMPIQVVAVLGKRSLTLKELIALKPGEVLELKKIPQDAIDLVANGKLIARGELVLMDGKLGIQIKQLVG